MKFIIKNSRPDFIITDREYNNLFKNINITKALLQNFKLFARYQKNEIKNKYFRQTI